MANRIAVWRRRTAGTEFVCSDFEGTMARARDRDIVYCDPPYSDTQSILYGAQEFSLQRLIRAIERARDRGAFVALSIDGSKKSGNLLCDTPLPEGLFRRTVLLDCGRSMLRRFQMRGRTLDSEVVADRLALTW
jgi:DNA adenine methylase